MKPTTDFINTGDMKNATTDSLIARRYPTLSATHMATELKEPINQLRKNVTSPKETTKQDLLSLEASGTDNYSEYCHVKHI